MADEPHLLSLPAAARYCGMKPETLVSFIRRGECRAFNLSRGVRPRYKIDPVDLQKFLDSRVVRPTPARAPRPRQPLQSDIPSRY